MKTYKVQVEDRDYKKWSYLDGKTLVKTDDIKDNPAINKLFSQDIIDENGNILHSSVRSMKYIPGVIVLTGNTFGRSAGSVTTPYFWYKCLPDDKRLPAFLISFKMPALFIKNPTNKYIIFRFKSWKDKHPVGECKNSLGDVTQLGNYYEYQLYCKSLYASIQNFKRETMKKIKEHTEESFIGMIYYKYEIEDRRNLSIYTIDPLSSKDFDDAFGIQMLGKDDPNYILSIYISNVSFWFDILDIWESFSERIATIYLPDRRRPMLPTVLSECLCSLQEKRSRFALTLDLHVNKDTDEIVKYDLKNTMIKVKKNYRYDTNELDNNEVKLAYLCVKNLNKNNKYIDKINSTHDMIAYMMILMNYYCARILKYEGKGLYRSSKMNINYKPPEDAKSDIKKFLKMWHSYGGRYCKHEKLESHDMLELDAYVHITSPIRRLPDLLNILVIQDAMCIKRLKDNGLKFYNKWMSDESVEYINKTMRSIRRVQNDCSMLKFCCEDEKIQNTLYEGFIFDKILRNDGLYQYMVYIKDIKMTNRLTSRYDVELNTVQKFKLYVFMDEIRLRRKLRIDLQHDEIGELNIDK